MNRSLWIAKTGMEGQQFKLDTISNNLANVGTSGFKRGGVVFEDLMYDSLRQVGAASSDQTQLPTGLQVGLGARVSASTRNFSQGNLQQSGNNLDIAIKGQGFFQIQMSDGSTGYSRDGAFQLDAAGQMVTSDGRGGLMQGYVEGSNVNVVEELVAMIATQRAYELNSKAIQTTDQMLARLGQL